LDVSSDPDAFAQLVRVHQAMVFSLARHLLGDADEAEEVAQEVFCKLFQHAEALESDRHVLFWLRRVTVHQALDHGRRRRVRPRVGLESAPEPLAPAAETDPWRAERLRDAVAALPPEQRAAVVLRYEEDMEPGEIAQLLRVSVHTVKSRLQRALRQLRATASACQPETSRR